MQTIVKTAISVPREDFKRVEEIRREKKRSRSQIFVDALHALFAQLESASLEERFVEGYRRHPDDAWGRKQESW